MTDMDTMLRPDFSVSTEIAGYYDELYLRMIKLWGFNFELYDFRSNTFMIIAMMAFSLLVFAIYGKYKSIQSLEVS